VCAVNIVLVDAPGPKDLRELRVVTHHRSKCDFWPKNTACISLDDAGIKLSGVAADIDGVYARKMVEERRLAGGPTSLGPMRHSSRLVKRRLLRCLLGGLRPARRQSGSCLAGQGLTTLWPLS
jgi:hypothetical protein